MQYILKLVLLLLSLNLFASDIILTKEEKNFIALNPEIKIALMPDFSPFSFDEDNKIIGFENDLLTILSQKTALKFKKEYGVWNQNLKAFQTKKVDMISSISYKKERESFTTFTKPYYEIPIMIFVRDDFGVYKGLESLKDKKVGILKDVFYTKELQEFGDINLIVYETYEEITRALVFGKIDALIQNLPNINYLIKKNLYSNLKLADELNLTGVKKEDLRFGINPNKPLLHSIVQKGLDSITKDEWQILTDRWIDVRYNEYLKNPNLNNTQKIDLVSLTKEERSYLKTKTINYCIDPSWEPFEYIDEQGNHNGLTKDYLNKIVEKTGMNVKLVKTNSWSETMQLLKNRSCDMTLGIAPTPSREEYLFFTNLYLTFPQVVAMKTDVTFISNMVDLLDKKVAIVKDFAIVEILKLKYPNFKPIEVSGVEEGLKKVASGDIDAFIDFLPSVSRGINQVNSGNLKIAGKIDEIVKLGAACRSDDPILQFILQKAIHSLESSDHKSILDKWMTIKYEYGTDYSLVWKIVLGAFCLFLLFGYWNYKIREAKKIIEKQNKELEVLATTDKLTTIYNRAKLDELLYDEIQRAKRYKHSFGCAIIDIDHFKKTNDTYGHLMGDKVLIEIASLIKTNIRKSDIFGRWGGEEFLLILPETNSEDISDFLNKIRIIITQHNILEVGTNTVSIGATAYYPNDTIDSIIKRADDALYKAKGSGRNKVVFH
jgi:polar amino acid transport system substrate-binding protein